MRRILILFLSFYSLCWDPIHSPPALSFAAAAVSAPAPHTELLTPYELFQQYQQGVDDWLRGTNQNGNGKEALEEALESISKFIPWLLSQSSIPPGLDPLVSPLRISHHHHHLFPRS
jgi:hypothetical protein